MAGPLSQRIRAKYPDAYTDMTDEQLEQAVTAKYPGVYDDLLESPQTPSGLSLAGTAVKTAAKDIFVAPLEIAGSLIRNMNERYGKAREAVGRGQLGTAVSEVVQGLPPVAMTRALVGSQLDQFGKARQAQTTPEMIGYTVAGLVPLVGPMASGIGEQIGTGDPEQMAEAAGHGLALLAGPKATSVTARGLAKTAVGTLRTGQRAATSIGRGVAGAAEGYAEGGIGGAAAKGISGAWRGATDPTAPVPLMVKALKPRNTKIKFEDTLETALPQVNRIVHETGKPITNAAEFLDTVKAAKKAVRAEYDALQGPRREIGSMVDGTPIADAMVASIPKKTRLENPTKARAIEQLAETYRRKFSLEDMEVLLQDANAELEGFYNQFPMARNREARFNPEIAPVVAQAKEMRDAIYGVLENPKQGGVARDLQRQYGALMEVENTAQRRTVVANRQQPESLSEQVGQVRAAADMARGAWKLAHFDPMGAADIAAGVAGRSMGKFLKDQQTMDALIRRAMSKYTKVARPIDIPPQPPIAGLLPPAVTRLDAVPESSGPSSVRGEYATPSYTQKMLPAPATPLPSVPDPPSRLVRGEYGAKWEPPPTPVAPPPPVTVPVQAAPVVESSRITPTQPPSVANLVARREAEIRAQRPVTPQLPPPLPEAAYTKAQKPNPVGARTPKQKPAPTPQASAAGTEPAPVAVAPTQPKAAIAAPEPAAEKVLRQIDHVIDMSGAKSAGELQARVLSGISAQLTDAKQAAGFNTVKAEMLPRKEVRVRLDGEVVAVVDQYGKVKVLTDDVQGFTDTKGRSTYEGPKELLELQDKSLNLRDMTPTERMALAGMAVSAAFSRMRGAGQLKVRIPGDGVFTIERNPHAITELMRRIQKGGPSLWKDLAKKR